MAVLKKIFSSLRKLFGRRLLPRRGPTAGGRGKKQRRKAKRKVRRKALPRVRREPLGRSRATRPSRKKIKKKQTVPSVERSPRSQAPAAVSASRGKSSSGKTQPPGQSAQAGQPAGEITHFFSKIQVAVVKMTKGNLAVGDKVRIQGKTTNFAQTIRSMQIESVDVRCARRGQLIGLKVERAAKAGDKLIRLR